MKRKILLLITTLFFISLILSPGYAESPRISQEAIISDFTAKVIAAAVAFTAAVISAGWAISRAGSAGLAASAERPEIRTVAIIISAFAEALAIYGIVISFFILGA
ncbi:MAG: ATP synthase subunit C [Aigarchaeota archaeon]|nr:ATP synthase subunit C [Aigarchaeota archaeon]MCX8192279.1 ATP synthase subunit C [Nitrososphaeria archaeon]MDW7986113.1 ATP synthase subunit C [Nitrososphaerota archaeon]